MEYLLALDQGTSSSHAIVFNRAGQVVASAQQEFPQHFSQPGWVEHDPFDIWNSQLATCYAALEQAKLSTAGMAVLGVTNQRETAMVQECTTGKLTFNTIVWQDRHTGTVYKRLHTEGLEDEVYKRTGLIIDPYFSTTRLRWILDHVNSTRGRAARGELAFGTVSSWLVWQLTRGRLHVTDVSNASRTMLWNVHTSEWNVDLIRALDIHPSLLPEVHPSAYQFEQTNAGWPGALLTIDGIANDQQSALLGQACFKPGTAKNAYGTGCFMLLNTGDKAVQSYNSLIGTAACQSGTKRSYALEGSVFVGDAVVQWLCGGLRTIQQSADVEGLAASVPGSGDVVFVPSFTGLEAPYWDPTAQDTIVSLSRGTTIGHIARTALESVAFQSTALLQTIARDAASTISELHVDGGASANNLLLQSQADLLGIPVVRPEIVETTTLGAAYLAGIVTGFYRDEAEITQQWHVLRTFHPIINCDGAAHRIAQWEMAVARVRLPTTYGH